MKEGDCRATANAFGEASSVPNEKGHGKGKGHGHGFGHHWLHHFKRHFGAGIGGCGNGTSGVHHNVVCDGCEQSPIVGTRFKSLEWDDYDLCEQCHRSRVDALGVPGDHQFQAIEPPQRGQWRCGGADFFDRILERLEEDPVAFYSNVSQMFDLQTMARKFAEVAIEVVVEMDKEELFGLLDPLSKISEEEVDERNFPEQARNIASIIHAAPEAVQSELKQRFCASAMKVFQTAGMGWHKGWGKGWKGCKGWKGWKGCKGAAKGWHKGARTSEQEPAPEAKRHCPTRSSTSDSVHENAISMLMSHPDAKIREAANMAMRQAEESMSSADVPTQKSSMPDPKPETSSGATASLSASLMGIPSVEVHSSAIQVDVSVAGDVSSAWMPILSQFPLLTTAVLLGHVACDSSSGPAEMLVHLSLVNDSCVPWPAETNLRIAAGDPFGCEVITVGEIPSGDVFQTVMKLNIPHAGGPSRSAWALESHGEPFGPMLILELQPIS